MLRFRCCISDMLLVFLGQTNKYYILTEHCIVRGVTYPDVESHLLVIMFLGGSLDSRRWLGLELGCPAL